MSKLDSLDTESKWNRFKQKLWLKAMQLKASVSKSPYEVVGYWNGICPRCKTHVGLNIQRHIATRQKHAWCGKCEIDFYKDIPKKEIVKVEELGC